MTSFPVKIIIIAAVMTTVSMGDGSFPDDAIKVTKILGGNAEAFLLPLLPGTVARIRGTIVTYPVRGATPLPESIGYVMIRFTTTVAMVIRRCR